MNKDEELYCLHDFGRRVSLVGRFVTHSGETIELAQCPYDGFISGFHWAEDAGWIPVFLWHEDSRRKAMVISLWANKEDQSWNEDEIAFELECLFAERHKLGQAGRTGGPGPSTANHPRDSKETADQVTKYDITCTSIALEPDGNAKPLDVRETIWDYAVSGLFGDVSRLISHCRLTTDWTSWEMHPAGDEIILLLDGALEVHLKDEGHCTTVVLDQSGAFARIPRGTWHTVSVHRAATVLMVTPCAETRKRAR